MIRPTHTQVLFGLAFVSCLLLSDENRCAASLLSLEFCQQPVILSYGGLLSYGSSSDIEHEVLHLESIPLAYIGELEGTGLFDLSTSEITIDFLVNATGDFAGNGTGLALSGDLDIDDDAIWDASGNLLEGTITNFGAEDAGPPPWAFEELEVRLGFRFCPRYRWERATNASVGWALLPDLCSGSDGQECPSYLRKHSRRCISAVAAGVS